MYYAGIGARQAPPRILSHMEELAGWLRHRFTLRSGHAPGADQAFESGAEGNAEIYLPWGSFERQHPILETAACSVVGDRADLDFWVDRYHPNPRALSYAPRCLMRRNVCQVFGPRPPQPNNPDYKPSNPSSFVLCWTKDGKASGGTGQAIRIAEGAGIPVFNLFHTNAEDRLRGLLFMLLCAGDRLSP